jgi:hypothetical protein
MCSAELHERWSSSPRFFYLISIGLQPVLAIIWSPLFSMASFTLCHWVAAVGLSSRIMAHHDLDVTSLESSPVRFRFYGHLIALILVSVPLYYLFMDARVPNWLGRVTSGADLADEENRGRCFSKLILFGYFGFGFVHFIYDRYLYEFRNKDVRTIVGARLYGVAES